MKQALVFFLISGAALAQRTANETTLAQVLTRSGGPGVRLPEQGVKGHPFSATEENHSTQVLADGTKIESSTVTKIYRDYDGRTRAELTDGSVTIADPVNGFQVQLNPKTKTAFKTNMPNPRAFGGVAVVQLNVSRDGESKEDLGVRTVNGVSAHGERITVTIPKGQIGNDRELKVVTERWTSDELQMLVKSSNKDPRYGETSYELTNISLAAPNPTLFEIPAEYTINSSAPGGRGKGSGDGARGARSGSK
jgi:hypothetical protein